MGQLCSITYVQEEGRGGGWGDCVQSHTYKRRGGVGDGVTVFNHIRTKGGRGGEWGNCVQSHTYKRRGGVGGGVTVFNHIHTRGGEGWGVGQLCSITYVQEEGRGGGWGDCVQSHTYKRRGGVGGGVTVFNHIRTRGGEGWGVGQLCSIAYIQEEGRGGGWGDCVQLHTYKRRGVVGSGATVFNYIRTRGGEGRGVG